jgi:hypothetical protein
MKLCNRRIDFTWADRRREQSPSFISEVLSGKLPTAAGAHAMAERTFPRCDKHRPRKKSGHRFDLAMIARRRGGMQVPRAYLAGLGFRIR